MVFTGHTDGTSRERRAGGHRPLQRGIPIEAHRGTITALICLGLAAGLAPVARAAGARAEAGIGFTIRIPPLLRMAVVQEQAGRTRLEVMANLRAYDLRFDVVDPDVVAVEIDGLGAPLVVGREGGLYRVFRRATAPVRTRYALTYRVLYSSDAHPGSRPSPLRVSAQLP
jgi:hypothetical protein